MIERLFRNLAPALNQDPLKVNAIQVNSTSIIKISIYDGIMQVEGLASYELSSYTIFSLASSLNTLDGLQADVVGYGELSALCLVDGFYSVSGNLPVFTSPLWQFGIPLSFELERAEKQTNNALFQANPRTASGVWLDSLGDQYGVSRLQNEPDSLYATRMFDFSLASRINNISIERTLNDLGYKATVTDTTPGPAFTVNVKLPTYSPNGFVYTTGSLSTLVDQLKASGIQSSVILQGDIKDTVHVFDSLTHTLQSSSWTVGDSLTIGQFTV